MRSEKGSELFGLGSKALRSRLPGVRGALAADDVRAGAHALEGSERDRARGLKGVKAFVKVSLPVLAWVGPYSKLQRAWR